nr:protein-glutamine gamma-glutamyltransferase K-like isoform X2 [Halisarca dujardinii]
MVFCPVLTLLVSLARTLRRALLFLAALCPHFELYRYTVRSFRDTPLVTRRYRPLTLPCKAVYCSPWGLQHLFLNNLQRWFPVMAATYRGAVDDKRTFRSHHFSSAYGMPNSPRGAAYILDKRKPLSSGGPSSKETSYVGEPVVTFEALDLFKATNESQHNTSMFESSKIVLRRGFSFKCRLTLSEDYDRSRHALVVEFRQGARPSFTGGSRFESIIGQASTHNWQWRGKIDAVVEKSVDVTIEIPVDTPVAEYEVIGEAIDLGTHRRSSKTAQRTAVVLFNPWHKGDDTHMESDAGRQEYVCGGAGRMWAGMHQAPLPVPWVFQQFASSTLEVVLYLLEKSGIDNELRRSPVHVSRLCASVISADSELSTGILAGNWSEDFRTGTPPTYWSGSAAIFEEFLRTRKPVKWAQSWVFAGILTSVLRCLGVPSRPVTNYNSLQSPDARPTTVQLDPKTLSLSGGHLWNYHVWVEGWMERPDLKGGVYGGWQALDSTPQPYNERSKVLSIGPASVVAMQQGKPQKYDSQFLMTAVRGETKFVSTSSTSNDDIHFKTVSAGKMILTKEVGCEREIDILSNYKEVVPMQNGDHHVATTATLGELELSIVPTRGTPVGQNIQFTMQVVSTATVELAIDFWARLSNVSYIGELTSVLMSTTESRTLVPGARIEVPFVVPPEEYAGKMRSQMCANLTVSVRCKDAEVTLTETLQLVPPSCSVQADAVALHVGQSTRVRAFFRNPLNVALNSTEWYIEGAGLTKPLVIAKDPVPPGKEAAVEFEVTAANLCELVRTLVVSFSSHELTGVKGTAAFPIGKRTIEVN